MPDDPPAEYTVTLPPGKFMSPRGASHTTTGITLRGCNAFYAGWIRGALGLGLPDKGRMSDLDYEAMGLGHQTAIETPNAVRVLDAEIRLGHVIVSVP